MKAFLRAIAGYLVAALIGAALLGVVLYLIKSHGDWPAAIGIGVGTGLLGALFPQKKKKEGADAPKGKDEILAGDPRASIDRLPADARDRLDASTKSDVNAQTDAVFKRHCRNGGADQGSTGG